MPDENPPLEENNTPQVDPTIFTDADSLVSDVWNTPFDSSATFNERGYNKSNKFSFDETEIINDFNGSLNLNFPLFNLKGPGDLDLNLSLNYCSALAHSIISASVGLGDDSTNLPIPITYITGGGRFPQYSFNCPGWLLSLNGVSIQVLNYDPNYFTKNISLNYIDVYNYHIKLLPLGHTITHEITIPNGDDNRDKIYILNGDGSVETLYNAEESFPTNQFTTGKYFSLNKHSYTKGIVEFLPPELQDLNRGIFNLRRLSLMKGDGKTYVYEEVRPSFGDFPRAYFSFADWFKIPKMFLLKSISDRFGHKIILKYNSFVNGRPEITAIECNWDEMQDSYYKYKIFIGRFGDKIEVSNIVTTIPELYGKYKIFLDNPVTIQRAYVTKILNLNNEETLIGYNKMDDPTQLDYIARSAQGLYYGSRSLPQSMGGGSQISIHFTLSDIAFNPLKRVTSITNVTGGIRLYKYKDLVDNLPMLMSDPDPARKIQSISDDNYFGTGRDVFFSQMLIEKRTYIGTSFISREVFLYLYTDSQNNREFFPIDRLDSYSTIRSVYSMNNTYLNETPSPFTVERDYRVYRIKDYSTNSNNHDSPGEIKLIEERFKVADEDPYTIKSYSYELGNTTSSGYTGSFLETQISETFNPGTSNAVTRTTSFTNYYFQSSDHGLGGSVGEKMLSDNYFDNPLFRKVTVDPLGRHTTTNFDYIYKNDGCYTNFDARYPPQPTQSSFEFIHFYIINLKIEERIANSKHEKWEYLKTNAGLFESLNGYIGQCISHKLCKPSDISQFLMTSISYYKFDNTGQALYPTSMSKPALEGNLKQTISPKGNITKYYYHPIQSSENELTNPLNGVPQVSFKKMLGNSSVETISMEFQDRRIPTRTDRYVSPTFYLSEYRLHDKFGNALVSNTYNKFITSYLYDILDRIKRVTGPYNFLPGDIFASTQDYTVRYSYDDVNNINSMFSKLSGTLDKRNNYLFDGFNRIRESWLFTDTSTINRTIIHYNYLGKVGVTLDPNSNYTKFSYDKYENVSKTEFTDESIATTETAFIKTIPNYFNGIPSEFIKREITKDQESKRVDKFYDAVGNLIRQINYVPFVLEIPDVIPEIEASTETLPIDTMPAITDFKYDDLNRLIQVKTAEGKNVFYEYDEYGHMKTMSTPDNGTIYYKYDNDGNIIFFQKHYAPNSIDATYVYYSYDGLNRLIGLGERNNLKHVNFDSLTANDEVTFLNATEGNLPSTENPEVVNWFDDYLQINVFDTFDSAPQDFFSPPLDFNSQPNYCLGKLLATAYRTRKEDPWSYKYFRYDANGRVVRMWNVIANLGTKVFVSKYNSSNLVTELTYQPDVPLEFKSYINIYDAAGRLTNVYLPESRGLLTSNIVNDDVFEDFSTELESFPPFVRYEYNNLISKVSKIYFNNLSYEINYEYDVRNWLQTIDDQNGNFSCNLEYYRNGNVKIQKLLGWYKNNFPDASYVSSEFLYDSDNRLIHTKKYGTKDTYDLDVVNTYDKDGNILRMIRNFNSDNFTYNYYPGTNKLQNASTSGNQFTYDEHGNIVSDLFSKNFDMKYDRRNLLLEVRSVRSSIRRDDTTFITKYWYDDKGNRIRKLVLRSKVENPIPPSWPDYEAIDPENPPIIDSDSEFPPIEPLDPDSTELDPNIPESTWTLYRDIFYMRDFGGNIISEYAVNSIDKWNIFGLGNIGRIEHTGDKIFYLKDHLESVRAEVNENNEVISAKDYDPWGFICREWQSNGKFKFISKERDFETSYDYFGARYYYSRFGRWGQIEPKYNKYIGTSPYSYANNNAISFSDKDGNDAIFEIVGNNITITVHYYYTTNEKFRVAALNSEKEKRLLTYVKAAATKWNEAGKNGVMYKGQKYNVTFKITATPYNTTDELIASYKEKGANYVISRDVYPDDPLHVPAATSGNVLILYDLHGFDEITGTHEAGHAMGLRHNPDTMRSGDGIMDHATQYTNDPTPHDIIEIFKRVLFEKIGPQLIRGAGKGDAKRNTPATPNEPEPGPED